MGSRPEKGRGWETMSAVTAIGLHLRSTQTTRGPSLHG